MRTTRCFTDGMDVILRCPAPGDAAAIAGLQERHAVQDQVDRNSTMERLPGESDVERSVDTADHFRVAVANGEVVGWGSLRSWTEDDGTKVYLTDGYVAPAFRRKGVGTLLLQGAEAAARQTARDEETAVLAGNASPVQAGRAALLTRNGYAAVFSMVEMELGGAVSSTRPVPAGLLVRDAVVDDAAALIDLTDRVWAGRPYFISPTVDRFRGWLSRSDLSLFQVATTGDRIIGFVASIVHATHAEVDDVQVDPDWQRRGLASALLIRNLELLAARGVRPIRLHTEGDDPAGALSLYRRLGFDVVREYHRYRKPLESPRG